MSELHDSRDAFADALRADMPPAPSDDALARVRAHATELRRDTRRSPASRRAWRAVGGLAAAAAVIAVAALVLAPRLETAAFARERAADALLLPSDGRVFHAVMRYTDTAWNEREGHDARYDLDQRWSSWVDITGKRTREEFVNVDDGSLDGLSVRIGDRNVVFQNNVRYMTGAKQQLIDQNVGNQPIGTAMGGMIDYLRARIADGSAKVVGSRTIDGEEYWVVEHKEEGDKSMPGASVLTVTMRKSDYRLKTWARDSTYENGDGKGTQTERIDFEVMELLDPSSLPDDFFSFDSVIAAAKPGTAVDKR